MQSLRPETLTNAELVKYAWLAGANTLKEDWIAELIKRLEATLDDNK